jgi:ATP-dependent DNA helicase RecQ
MVPLAMADAHSALSEHFGFERFRPGQEEVVNAVLGGRDVLVVMPTGAGKSLCYQLPALMRPELTVVVSPLVSLMHDQVAGLERGAAAGRAALINSQRAAGQNRAALAAALAGELRLLYVAPERFAAPGFVDALREARVGLFVVDEAHCISQWGHDFRPDYFELPAAARALGARQLIALTATATPRVAGDIVVRLGLRDPVRVTTGFDRPNLSYLVVPSANDADRRRRIAAVLADPQARPAIVYAGTRARTEELAAALSRQLGLEALAYHAGLDREQRSEAQRRFMAGDVEIVVATNAFGMGIDKSNVRTVCHASVPESLEAYYQEAGRAGRDGRHSRCLLFAAARDKGLHVHFIQQSPRGEAQSARWAQYRAIWAFVEGEQCRRAAIQRHFGDRAAPTVEPDVHCCDVCAPEAAPRLPAAARAPAAAPRGYAAAAAPAGLGPAPGIDLDRAIVEIVVSANPSVGRTRTVEILRGGRSKPIQQNAYDTLAGYGAYAHLSAAEVLGRVDALLERGLLRSTGGRFPKLALGRERLAA